MNLLDYFKPQASQVADAAATSAVNTALDEASARPFAVILSVEQGTQLWIAGLLVSAALWHLLVKR